MSPTIECNISGLRGGCLLLSVLVVAVACDKGLSGHDGAVDSGRDAGQDAAGQDAAGGVDVSPDDGGWWGGGTSDADPFLADLCRERDDPENRWQSSLVRYGSDGKLSYQRDGEGNRIVDFSYAGYRNGEIPLPDVATVKEIDPVDGDDTAHVQAALDEVGALPQGQDGFRGALLLRAGEYQINGTLTLPQSGVVLRGVGDGADPAQNTILVGVGDDPHQRTIVVAGSGNNAGWRPEVPDTRTDITSPLVAVGERTFEVTDGRNLSVGDNVVIVHPCTAEWLAAVDHGGTDTDEPWSVGSEPLYFTRYITAIDGNQVTIDAPVFNHLNRSLSQSYLYVADRSWIATQIGIERLRVDIQTAGGTDEQHAWNAIAFVGVEDAWATDTTVLHFGKAGFVVKGGSRITVARCRALDPVSQVTGGRRYNFNVEPGQLVLFTECEASAGRHHFVSNGTSKSSGVVFHRCTSRSAYTASEGHRRWSMALLYDNITEVNVRSGGLRLIGLYNRGSWGTGHGWAVAHAVAWAYDVGRGRGIIQKPPTAQNYAIGGAGEFSGNHPPAPFAGPAGHIEGIGRANLVPASLYRAQLRDRLCP
jgi:hypothetical protein